MSPTKIDIDISNILIIPNVMLLYATAHNNLIPTQVSELQLRSRGVLGPNHKNVNDLEHVLKRIL